LDRGLLIAADDVVAGVQQFAFPAARVRSRIRPALAVNAGSRGKIHERCCQGLIASSESQRQTVTPEICSQIPRAIASAASSEDDQRSRARRSRS
jgi:predicted transcriptional regulator